MIMHIVLDSFPVGAITHPHPGADALAVPTRTAACRVIGHRLYLPEIIDYEIERELVRAGNTSEPKKPDGLKALLV